MGLFCPWLLASSALRLWGAYSFTGSAARRAWQDSTLALVHRQMITAATAGILASVSLGECVPTRSIIQCYSRSTEREENGKRDSALLCVDCDACIVQGSWLGIHEARGKNHQDCQPCICCDPSSGDGVQPSKGSSSSAEKPCSWLPCRRRPQLRQKDYLLLLVHAW
ncbi:hypothetical protein HDV57DRAFT_323734 [Trichoderma longibrachiatum]|uniref:C2H2-type domain-containing protein n=1 Tax=Trichoderma longibrachiatum ATCC 18648 TaxID=983965 RepID=A0A2T4BW17_TRILO|nr:hypothetical protein M440DRAFT_1063970 [Trichoderma longibrachiatum ATCC 18648]